MGQGEVREEKCGHNNGWKIEIVFIWELLAMWQVLRDINELITEEPKREEIKIGEIDRIKRKRYKKEVYRQMIHNYLRKYQKWIWMLSKEDIAIMTEGMDTLDKTLFMDQVKYCLETTWGKPIKWIVQNNKSILFDKK